MAGITAVETGTVLGGFRVERLLGEGSTAHVYLARDTTLGRAVALKVFKPNALEHGTERFLAEARLTASLDHPHVVRVLQSGTTGDSPFLALEYVEGTSLGEALGQGPIDLTRSLDIAIGIMEGLVCLHERGLVHGDLKPDNVLVPVDGRVRLADFGLTTAIGQRGGGLGSGAWLSPQRWRGDHSLDAADDVWAFGVILVQLLAGEPPWSARAVSEASFARVPLEPPRVPGPLGKLAADCLAWKPEERPRAPQLLERLQRTRGEVRPPFRGLAAFGEDDGDDLHGREEEGSAAAALLRAHPLVLVTGPSGVGKSSFVHAGVVTRLRREGRAVVTLRPGARPLDSLARALGEDGAAARLKEAPARATRLVSLALKAGRRPITLVVDQLEEAFTLAPEEDRQAFFAALAAACAIGAGTTLLLVRDDFLGRVFQTSLGALQPAVLALRPLSLEALERAIRAPVLRCRGTFSPPSLPSRIAQEVFLQPAPLPLLQFICRALWERRDVEQCVLRGSDYEQLGGAAGALVARAHDVLRSLDAEARARMRALLLEVVNPDGTRRPRSRGELRDGGLIDELVASRLLVVRQEAETAMVELAHESLTTLWPDLRRWIEESTEAHRLQRDLENAAERWERLGRRREDTWRGDPVASLRARLAGLSVSERAERFLEASEHEALAAGTARKRVITAVLVGAVALAIGSTTLAIRFRENERRAIEQQEQLTTIAENLGDVELTFAPFEWDGRSVTPVEVKSLDLSWRLWPADSADRDRPRLEHPLQIGRLQRWSPTPHSTTVRFEAPGGDAFLEIFGRGGGCDSSWVRLRGLPGHTERRRGRVYVARVPVPTCHASSLDEVSVGTGLWIDRTESTNALFAPFESMLAPMGYERLLAPETPSLREASLPMGPVTGIDAKTAAAYCRFLGKRLPSANEWERAWGAPTAGEPNLESGDPWPGPASVDDPRLEVSALGLRALDGNVREWTSTPSELDDRQLLFKVMGGDWTLPPSMLESVRFGNRNHPYSMDFALGVRCARRTNLEW
jgi:predicted Ser/Thr protein kinase